MNTNTSANIFSNSIPAIRTNIATCGLVTVCDAVVPKPSELDSIFKDGDGNYRIMEGLFMHQLELNSCNIVQSNLYNFLMANKVDLKHKLNAEVINSGLSKIRPYILIQRKHPINNNYWNVSGGVACSANGTSPGDSTHWKVTATSPTNIPANAGWFNTPERVFIKGKTVGGTSTDTAFQVTSATVSDSNITLVLLPQNTGSFLPTAQVTLPVTGLLVRGTANIADYESFCARPPGLITSNLEPFWIETTRDATCVDELYNQWRDLVYANNPLYAKYFDLPTIEYNKQSGEDFQRRFVNTFFFNKALPNQDISTVEDLESIETVPLIGEESGRCVGKRANAIGVFEQYAQFNRIIDLQGDKLNIPALLEQIYVMQRVREDSGASKGSQDVFEIMIPSQFFPAWNLAMLQYYKAQSNGLLQMFQDVSKGGVQTAPLGFKYRDYPVMWPNVTLRIITDKFFDDYLQANTAVGQANVGRMMWIMDWSRIYLGIFASDRVVNQTGDLKTLAAVDPTYACVMRVPTKTTTLTSFTWTAICEAPQGDLIIQNFSGEVPEAEVQGNVVYPLTTTTTTTTTTAP